MTNTFTKTVAAIAASFAFTATTAAQDFATPNFDLTAEIAASTQKAEDKILDLVMQKADTMVENDLLNIGQSAPVQNVFLLSASNEGFGPYEDELYTDLSKPFEVAIAY